MKQVLLAAAAALALAACGEEPQIRTLAQNEAGRIQY